MHIYLYIWQSEGCAYHWRRVYAGCVSREVRHTVQGFALGSKTHHFRYQDLRPGWTPSVLLLLGAQGSDTDCTYAVRSQATGS